MSNNIKITKRFVISKNLVKNNVTLQFTNYKNETYTYNAKEVYEANQERFDNMNCYAKYNTYTNSKNVPTFARELATLIS